MRPPDYSGGGLVNLVAEIEHRLGGDPPSPRLRPGLREAIPDAENYLLVLFDGLGSHQLNHPGAVSLSSARRADIEVGFPTTTTVSMATIATGLPPSQHGLLGYQLNLGGSMPMNTIWWTDLHGRPYDGDLASFLPGPNLWERLGRVGVECISLQPRGFEGTALTDVLYRGARFEGWDHPDDAVTAALQLCQPPRRLVLLYLPYVDFAAHVDGQGSTTYDEAMRVVDAIWSRLEARLPEHVGMIGTADHGHLDIPPHRRLGADDSDQNDLVIYGDPRAAFVDGADAAQLAARIGAQHYPAAEVADWWGPEPRHPAFDQRLPGQLLMPPDGHIVVGNYTNDRLVGYHGGLQIEERTVPLLVAG